MQEGFISSSESEKCVVCGRKTANYKTYEQAGITIVIPLCDDVYNSRYCWRGVDVKSLLKQQLIELKRAVVRTSLVKVLPKDIEPNEQPSEAVAEGG